MKQRSRILLVAAACSVPCGALALASNDVITAGWSPMVAIFGGDTQTGVRSLAAITRAYDAFLSNTVMDDTTEEFIDDANDELKDFDLGGLRKILPDEEGKGRALHVKGELSGNAFRVSRASRSSAYKVGRSGPRNGLADMHADLYAEEREVMDEERYMMGFGFGLGVGPISWPGLMRAERELASLATLGTPDPARMQPVTASSGALSTVRAKNPGLGKEDAQVLAVLYDAYPEFGEMLTHVGVIEDVLRGPTSDGVYPIRLRMHADTKRLAEHYKYFAEYAEDLDDVMIADITLRDDQGRSISEIHIDSDKLLVELKAFIKDGLPVPFKGNHVFADQPMDPLTDLHHPTVHIKARLNFLGIIANLDNLLLDATYKVDGGGAVIDGKIASTPSVRVEGRAFGLFAPRFVNLFIPGDIQSQTKHFFGVLANGNNGRGSFAHIEIGSQQEGGNGVVDIDGEFEAIDTFIVRIGAGVVADKVILGKRAEEDANRLAADLHRAFKNDFERFRKNAGG